MPLCGLAAAMERAPAEWAGLPRCPRQPGQRHSHPKPADRRWGRGSAGDMLPMDGLAFLGALVRGHMQFVVNAELVAQEGEG